ncbi:MAG: hypothetical protein ACO3PX_18280 [bacterium]
MRCIRESNCGGVVAPSHSGIEDGDAVSVKELLDAGVAQDGSELGSPPVRDGRDGDEVEADHPGGHEEGVDPEPLPPLEEAVNEVALQLIVVPGGHESAPETRHLVLSAESQVAIDGVEVVRRVEREEELVVHGQEPVPELLLLGDALVVVTVHRRQERGVEPDTKDSDDIEEEPPDRAEGKADDVPDPSEQRVTPHAELFRAGLGVEECPHHLGVALLAVHVAPAWEDPLELVEDTRVVARNEVLVSPLGASDPAAAVPVVGETILRFGCTVVCHFSFIYLKL